MKLITLNVALFEANNSKLVNFLKSTQIDIACFQEVTRSLDKSVDKEYVSKDEIDKGTRNLKYSFFGPIEVFGKIDLKNFHGKEDFHFDPKGLLELGNYTKTCYEITKAQNIFLEGNLTYDINSDAWEVEQDRAIVVADLFTNGKKLRVINYHGIWTKDKKGNEKTLDACKKILKIAKKFNGNVIICGDFNLFPGTVSIKQFNQDFISLVDKYNIRTTRPSSNELNKLRNVVDYIFVDRSINVNSFEVIDNDVSDHLPLILNFDL